MKTAFKIDRPDEVPMTLTVTMNLGKWLKLQEQLQSTYPSWKLSAAISDMVLAAKKAFYPSDEGDDKATGEKA